ncbi:transcription termination/antitermination factor NusG, partial [Frankia sp. AgKG'84/4]|nr:transcription termination/antitermination factor NusG [Frankia sp. AgKG'84/4]
MSQSPENASSEQGEALARLDLLAAFENDEVASTDAGAEPDETAAGEPAGSASADPTEESLLGDTPADDLAAAAPA